MEEFILILWFDTDAWVLHGYRHPFKVDTLLLISLKFWSLWIYQHLSHNFNVSIPLRELNSVRKQVQKNLLEPLLICFHIESWEAVEILVLNLTFYILHRNFVLKDFYDLVYGVSYIKNCQSSRELWIILVKHCEVKHVMHKVIYELGGWHYFLAAVFEPPVHLVHRITED